MDATQLNLDVSAEGARALHRVVRAMHDGHCPSCGYLAPSSDFEIRKGLSVVSVLSGHRCPQCQFTTTREEELAALQAFQPYFHKSVDVFEAWRSGQPLPV